MSINYDVYGKIEPSKIYLCNTNQEKICCLNGIDIDSCEFSDKVKDYNTISFKVNKYVNVDGKDILSSGYDMLSSMMELYVDNIGRFIIDCDPDVENDGISEYKTIDAKSLEYKFSFKDLVDFKINTGETTSYERLIEGNVDSLGITKKYIQFYDSTDSDFSLINILINKIGNGWTVGTISPIIAVKKYAFNIESQSVYSFMMQDVSSTYKCIFNFDTINKKINVYDSDSYGEDTNIYISFTNLAKSINIKPATDDLYTRYTVRGDDNLDISQVNFGSDKIEDISHFLNTNFVSQSIINKYTAWKNYRDSKRSDYVALIKSYTSDLETRDEIINRVPCDGLSTDWGSFTNEDLTKEKTYYQSLVDGIEELFTTGGVIDEDTLEASVYWWDYTSYKTWIIPNIDIAIDNLNKTDGNKTDYLNSWETQWDLFGTQELLYKINVYNEEIEASKNYSKAWSALTDTEKASYNETLYTTLHQKYVDAQTNRDNAKDKYDDLMVDVAAYNTSMEATKQSMTDLVSDVSMTNTQFGFTDIEINTIENLYIDTDYTNDNYLVSSIYTGEDKIDEEELLYNDALDQLSKESHTQFSFSCELNNLLALDEFKDWHSHFKCGNFIRLGVYDDYQEKLRLLTVTFNPMTYDDNNFSVEFSNILVYNGKRNDFTSLFDNAISSSKNSINSTNSSSSDSDNGGITNELIKYIMNSRYMSDKMENLSVKNLTATTGTFDVVLANYVKTSVLQTEIATAITSTVDTQFVKDLIAGHATLNDLFTSNFTVGSDDDGSVIMNGSTMQFKDENQNVYIQLGTDADGGHSLIVSDSNGTALFNGSGVTENAIADGLIVSDMLKKKDTNYSGIGSDALNINDVTSSVINDNSFKVTSAQVYFDDDDKSLNTKFTEMTNSITTISDNSKYDIVITSSNGIEISSNTILTCNVYNKGTLTPATDTFTYQWYKNGIALTGKTNSTLSLTISDIETYGNYTCKITY